jgi:hypothetical protein
MATRYKATITVECWKQHTCVCCSGVFRYRFTRTSTGEGGTEESASAAARAQMMNTLANEVDVQPCPSCGYVQPDMVGSRRAVGHAWVLGGLLVAMLVLIILALTEVMLPKTVVQAAIAIGGLALAAQLIVALRNPNSNLASNKASVERLVERGTMEIRSAGKIEEAVPETLPRAFGVTTWIALLLMLVGVLAMGACEVQRRLAGWPLNDAWYPPVVGPGDSSYVYTGKVSSVKGYWTGTVVADVTNAAELGLPNPRLAAETHTANWGNSISVKSSEKSSNSNLWARIHVPNEAKIAGKDMKVSITIGFNYPVITGGNNFRPEQGTSSYNGEIKLASPYAGESYRKLYWNGLIGGIVLMSAASIWLLLEALAFKKKAHATEIEPIGGTEPEEE